MAECSFCGLKFDPTNQFESTLLHYLDHLTEILNEWRVDTEEAA